MSPSQLKKVRTAGSKPLPASAWDSVTCREGGWEQGGGLRCLPAAIGAPTQCKAQLL